MLQRYPGSIVMSAGIHGIAVLVLFAATYAVRLPSVQPTSIQVVEDYFSAATAARGPDANAEPKIRIEVRTPAVVQSAPDYTTEAPVVGPVSAGRVSPVTSASPVAETRPTAKPTPRRPINKKDFDAEHPAVTTSTSAKSYAVRKIDLAALRDSTGESVFRPSPSASAGESSPWQTWDALLREKLLSAFQPPEGIVEDLRLVIAVQVQADGSLIEPRVQESSGNATLDAAALSALTRIRMPASPSGETTLLRIPFHLRNGSWAR